MLKFCRYVVAVASIAGAYCIVQLPFSIYYAVQQKRLIRNGFLPEFDFYGDKVLTFYYSIYNDENYGQGRSKEKEKKIMAIL